MRARVRIAASVAAVSAAVALVTAGFALGSQGPENPTPDTESAYGAPYCMVDRDTAAYGYVTVSGPADGYVTAGTREGGRLTHVGGDYADEVGPDAEPYAGILYNVRVSHAQQPVAVDGIVCETT